MRYRDNLAVFDDGSSGSSEMGFESVHVHAWMQIVDNHAVAAVATRRHRECSRDCKVGIFPCCCCLVVIRHCLDKHCRIHTRCAVHQMLRRRRLRRWIHRIVLIFNLAKREHHWRGREWVRFWIRSPGGRACRVCVDVVDKRRQIAWCSDGARYHNQYTHILHPFFKVKLTRLRRIRRKKTAVDSQMDSAWARQWVSLEHWLLPA